MLQRIINKLFYYYYKQQLGGFGFGSVIYSPLRIDGKKNVIVGKSVIIQYKTWLASMPLVANGECLLQIGDGSCIGNFNHIYATKKVIIGTKVLTADKVYISDNLHSYQDINIAILDQPVKQNNEVIIGDGTWIGENVCILGVTIGKNCVIGANAVVTKNLPDYSIAVGNPAKIIKRFCLETNQWRKTFDDGKFI
jgi:acetyltransferase-like isoleucine patch superfamily enzyme